jgi:hypothetical protein
MSTAAQEENVTTVGAQDSPMARKLRRELPQHIYAVAARNARNRFFIPSKTNHFAGMRYDYVMIDNGCNTFRLPFNEECMTLFRGEMYQWQIAQSRGTGAVKSPTLIITIAGGVSPLGSMSLAGSGPLLQLTRLRFHLGTESARLLSSHAKLSDNSRTILTIFLSQMGNRVSPERHHVLLGQAYLKTVLSLQLGGIIMMGDATVFPTLSDYNRVAGLLEALREDFPEFDDLEDEDHDEDADEEYLQYEDIDEPVDEYME